MAGARVYFTSIDTQGKGNLWVTDGTAAGTTQVRTIAGGASGLYPGSYVINGGSVYFRGTDNAGLFALDVTTNGVTELQPANAGASLGVFPKGTVAYAGKLYFQGQDAAGHYTLWSSDGTSAGTAEVPIAGLNDASFYPGNLTPFAGKLAFSGSPSTVSTGLYLTDGTSAGTAKVQITNASFVGLQIHTMASLGAKLVFEGTDAAFHNVLYVSDGTAEGTTELTVPGLNPTGGYPAPAGLASFGTKAAFTAADSAGKYGIWITDGTVAGTFELPGLYGNSYGAPMASFAGGRLAVVANDANGVSRLWITDGTAAGTAALQVAGASPAGLSPHGLMAMGNDILFDGVTASGARGLFISDGTSAGTTFVKAGINLIAGNIGTDAAALGGTVAYTDTVTGISATAVADIYTGPVSYLQSQYVWSGNDSVALRADAPNTFLKGGAGGDALQVAGGNNVLDGGGGSNFLIGGTGSDGGADTFFVDGRGGVETWSTIVNFHQGDQATIFGFHSGLSTMPYTASDGAAGYQGLTIHSELNGVGTGILGSMTFTGIDQATADAHFSITSGTLLPGTPAAIDYLLIQYNR